MSSGQSPKISARDSLKESYIIDRLKAFVIDMFMIYTPILYFTTYVVLDGASSFRENHLAIFLCMLSYGVIEALFLCISGQTPGLKGYNLMVLDKNSKKISFIVGLIRFFVWLVSIGMLFGIVFVFLNKEKKTFHDFLLKTTIMCNRIKN